MLAYLIIIVPLALIASIILYTINPFKYKPRKQITSALVVFSGVVAIAFLIEGLGIILAWIIKALLV